METVDVTYESMLVNLGMAYEACYCFIHVMYISLTYFRQVPSTVTAYCYVELHIYLFNRSNGLCSVVTHPASKPCPRTHFSVRPTEIADHLTTVMVCHML